MKYNFLRIKWFLINCLVAFIGIFIKRDSSVILIGAWMGNQFSDNSRYLFEYLNEHGNDHGIKKVIWFTRNDKVYNNLKANNYFVVREKTLDSLYWHLRSGVHIVCNAYCTDGFRIGDIDGEYSFGARKIQLWHGVTVKACHLLTNNYKNKMKKNSSHTRFIKNTVKNNSLFSAGGWKNCFFLVTSEENARVAKYDYGIDYKNMVYSCYPRLCEHTNYFENEIEILNNIKELKKNGYKIALYLPTFRNDNKNYTQPQEINGFIEKLNLNNIIFAVKQHSANKDNRSENNNIYNIPSDFDVNLLYSIMDIVISDCSSATSDCIFLGIPTISYFPDYSDFEKNDRGFVGDYFKYNIGPYVQNPDDLADTIIKYVTNTYFSEEMKEKYIETQKYLFGCANKTMREIVKDLL